MDISVQLEQIRSNNFKQKIENEIKYLKENGKLNIFSNYQDTNMEERLEWLNIILDNINKDDKIVKPDVDVKQKRKDMFSEIDKYTYKKQWNKLTNFHKLVKIKEFITENYEANNFRDEILAKLTLRIDDNTFNTKKYVIYDPNAEKILSIPALTVDITKKIFDIKI